VNDWQDGPVRVLVGDCRGRLRDLPDASVDALVTDPPAGISFMGRSWDHDRGGRDAWVRTFTATFREVRRVLKPGAHGLVWALPRTSHWTATALEDAGFEVRDIVHHHFGSGFPKSKNLDGEWEGWGTALKPATEHWILVRKPLSEPNVAANVQEHGTGALHIDGCRIHTAGSEAKPYTVTRLKPGATLNATGGNWRPEEGDVKYHGETRAGRWPANLVLSHAEGCRTVGAQTVRSDGHYANGRGHDGAIATGLRGADAGGDRYTGRERVEAWECVAGCPVAELDRQSGRLSSGFMAAGTEREGLGYRGGLGTRVRHDTIGDTGGASRFFYVAKASAAERGAGLPPGDRNTHPTVKSIALMRWLCLLVTPPGGVVLDPFMGSGTTGCAAVLEGLGFVGIEQDSESVRTAIARLVHWSRQPRLDLRPVRSHHEIAGSRPGAPVAETLPLFDFEDSA